MFGKGGNNPMMGNKGGDNEQLAQMLSKMGLGGKGAMNQQQGGQQGGFGGNNQLNSPLSFGGNGPPGLGNNQQGKQGTIDIGF